MNALSASRKLEKNDAKKVFFPFFSHDTQRILINRAWICDLFNGDVSKWKRNCLQNSWTRFMSICVCCTMGGGSSSCLSPWNLLEISLSMSLPDGLNVVSAICTLITVPVDEEMLAHSITLQAANITARDLLDPATYDRLVESKLSAVNTLTSLRQISPHVCLPLIPDELRELSSLLGRRKKRNSFCDLIFPPPPHAFLCTQYPAICPLTGLSFISTCPPESIFILSIIDEMDTTTNGNGRPVVSVSFLAKFAAGTSSSSGFLSPEILRERLFVRRRMLQNMTNIEVCHQSQDEKLHNWKNLTQKHPLIKQSIGCLSLKSQNEHRLIKQSIGCLSFKKSEWTSIDQAINRLFKF